MKHAIKEEPGMAFKSSQGPVMRKNQFRIDCIASLKDPTIRVELKDIASLNSRINNYFKAMKKMQYTIIKMEQKIGYKDIEIQLVEHVKD